MLWWPTFHLLPILLEPVSEQRSRFFWFPRLIDVLPLHTNSNQKGNPIAGLRVILLAHESLWLGSNPRSATR